MSTEVEMPPPDEPPVPFEELLCRLASRDQWLVKLDAALGEADDLLGQMHSTAETVELRREILALRKEVGQIRNGGTGRLVTIHPFRMETSGKGGKSQGN